MRIQRLPNNPIVRPHMDSRMGDNVNGPSLIRVPDWLPNPLGRYYLYFAHHKGTYIRLAHSDHLEGPWTTYEPGTLHLDESHFTHHIASPDVHVDNTRHEIRMYYHGCTSEGQKTRAAVSGDGIRFEAMPEVLGDAYFRVFRWDGCHYAIAMPGTVLRSADGLTRFEQGPTLFSPDIRHSALKLASNNLTVLYSNAGDRPERILMSTVDLDGDWLGWKNTPPVTVLEPETDYEGAGLPLEASARGWAPCPVRQIRDPAIFTENGRDYLLYSIAGEHGIAIAQILD